MPKHVSSGHMFGDPFATAVPDLDRTDHLLMLCADLLDSGGEPCSAPDLPGRLKAIRARGTVEAVAEPTGTVLPGVVSLPHGWGHDRPGIRTAVAARHAGVSVTTVTGDLEIDPLSGNAVFNGVRVTL